MSDEGREYDPLIDAGLEEVLGGRRPPNLAPRIAQAWALRTGQTPFAVPQNGRGQYAAPIPLSPLPVAPSPTAIPVQPPMAEFVGLARPVPVSQPASIPVAQPTAPPRSSETTPPGGIPSVQGRPRAPKGGEATWMPWIIAAGLLLTVSLGGYAIWRSMGDNKPIIVEQGDGPRKQPDRPQLVKTPDTPKVPKTPKPGVTPNHPPEMLAHGEQPRVAVDPIPEPQIVALIDESLAAAWLDHGVEAAEPADDEQWCRRLFLRTLGRIPTVKESRTFLADKSETKRGELAERLLTAPEYNDEVAKHWSGIWTTALLGRTPDPGLRSGLRTYLEQAIRTNKPYDAMVTELVTASGPADGGAVDFLLALADKDDRAQRTTSRTAQVLLGAQLECARCHEHPFQKIGPEHYWAMNSFFRQMEVRSNNGLRELARVDFAGEGDANDGGVRYVDPDGKPQVAFPRLLDGNELAKSGKLAEADRRKLLAKEIVQSSAFGRTLVNRLWGHYFGVGFVRPVDQLSPRGEASHPELLENLAGQFAAHGHDLRKAMRWIVSSQAFSLSTKARDHNNTRDEPLAGTAPLFSHFYVRPSTAERIDQSLVVLADAARTGRSIADEKNRIAWLQAVRIGPDLSRIPEGIEAPPSGAPIGQAVDLSEGGFVDRLATSKLSTTDKITHLFVAALGREPSASERDAAKDLFTARKDDTIAALQDLWWALLHSNEFNGL